MAAPNVVNVSSILGKTDVLDIDTVEAAITTNSVGSNKLYKINSLLVSNIDGTNDADVSVDLFRANTAYYIAKTITVPAYSSLVALDKDYSVYLMEGDKLQVQASASGLQAICAYTIISDTSIALPGRPSIN